LSPLLGCCVSVVCLGVATGACQADGRKDGTADRIAGLVAQLGDDQFARREAAGRALVDVGRPAVPALRVAAANGNAEVRERAERLIAVIARRAADAELAKWAGSWTGPRGSTLTIQSDRFESSEPEQDSFRGTIQIVDVSETRVQADLRIEEEGKVVMVVEAIVRLDGDTLHYCTNFPVQPRPIEFSSKGTNYYVPWKRAKK